MTLTLAPGESRRVSITADPRLLANFDTQHERWQIAAGAYHLDLGASSRDLRLTATTRLVAQTLPP